MLVAIGLIALVLGAARYALRPGSSSFTVLNRSGRAVSQVEVVLNDRGGPLMQRQKSPVVGDTYGFQNLADGSTATATFLSYGVGSWCRAPRWDSFLIIARLEDGTSIQGRFGHLPEPGSRRKPLFIIEKNGDVMLTTRERAAWDEQWILGDDGGRPR